MGLVEHEQRAVTGAHLGQLGDRRLVASNDARCSTSLCRNTSIADLDSRQPSMIDAWFSSSLNTVAPRPPNVVSTPAFAA